MAQPSCFSFPLADSLLSPFFVPFTYLETLLAVTGSVHFGLRLLINWPPLSQPFPLPPHSKFPVPRLNMRLTSTTSRIWLLLSRTVGIALVLRCWAVFCRFLEPSFCIQHESISGQYCLIKAGVVVKICKALRLVSRASPSPWWSSSTLALQRLQHHP